MYWICISKIRKYKFTSIDFSDVDLSIYSPEKKKLFTQDRVEYLVVGLINNIYACTERQKSCIIVEEKQNVYEIMSTFL